MRTCAALIGAILVALPTAALAQSQVDIIGGNGQNSTGSGSYKLDIYEVSRTIHLDELEVYLEPGGNGNTVWFVIYESAGGGGPGGSTWDLVWDSGAVSITGGGGFKSGGPANLILQGGTDYAMGVFLPAGNDTTYFYGDIGGQDLGWAFVDTGLYANNGTVGANSPPDPIVGNGNSNSPYHQQITVSAGVDGDGDGWGDLIDCDDTDPNVYPQAPEACDGVDNDCDGQIDEDVLYRNVFEDLDGDGWGDPNGNVLNLCEPDTPAGYAERGEDCDDTNAAVNPGEAEICDGFDTNCDGVLGADEGTDADGDGSPSCIDCDDADPDVYPGRETDPCNGVDSDCDGKIPESAEECDPLESGEGLSVAANCGCSSSGSAPAGLWLGLGLLALIRRRE